TRCRNSASCTAEGFLSRRATFDASLSARARSALLAGNGNSGTTPKLGPNCDATNLTPTRLLISSTIRLLLHDIVNSRRAWLEDRRRFGTLGRKQQRFRIGAQHVEAPHLLLGIGIGIEDGIGNDFVLDFGALDYTEFHPADFQRRLRALSRAGFDLSIVGLDL